MTRRFHGSCAFALTVLLAACAPPDEYEITLKRLSKNYPSNLEPGGSGQARFGGGMGMPSTQRTQERRPSPFISNTPEGWEKLAPTSMRVINFRPAGDPNTECSLVILGGDGGGLTANINRWRDQIGLEPITDQEVDALPSGLLMGMNAKIVSLSGSYSGMGDTAQADWGLYGYILLAERFTIFAKMTGPQAIVEQETGAFQDWCASISTAPEVGAAGDDGHNHDLPEGHSADDGHNHDLPAGHSADDGHDHGPPAKPGVATQGTIASETGEFNFDLPAGWSEGPKKSMRVLNLVVGSSECYVILLGGSGGGLEGNINRWRGEVGMGPASAVEIAALEKISILGEQAPMLEVTGNYQGMSETDGNVKRVLGVPLIRSGKSVFIKMVGPDSEVAAQRDAFIAFVKSLSER